MPELILDKLLAIEELGQIDLAELNHDIGQVRALCEDRRQAMVDLLQERAARKTRIRELERLIAGRWLGS